MPDARWYPHRWTPFRGLSGERCRLCGLNPVEHATRERLAADESAREERAAATGIRFTFAAEEGAA